MFRVDRIQETAGSEPVACGDTGRASTGYPRNGADVGPCSSRRLLDGVPARQALRGGAGRPCQGSSGLLWPPEPKVPAVTPRLPISRGPFAPVGRDEGVTGPSIVFDDPGQCR